jgi:hypothetical protein
MTVFLVLLVGWRVRLAREASTEGIFFSSVRELKIRSNTQMKKTTKNKIKLVSRDDLIKLIKATDKRLFKVTFRKKDGEWRDMIAQYGIESTKGGKLSFDAEKKGLIVVLDKEKEEYRMIVGDSIISAVIDGQSYLTKEAKEILDDRPKKR